MAQHTRGKRGITVAVLAAAALAVGSVPGASASATTPVTQVPTPNGSWFSTLAPDHRHLYVTGRSGITVVDVTTKQTTSSISFGSTFLTALIFNRTGSVAYFGYQDASGTPLNATLNPATGAVTTIPVPGTLVGVTPDGGKLYTLVTTSTSVTLEAYSTSAFTQLAAVDLPAPGDRLDSAGTPLLANGNVYVPVVGYDFATARLVGTVKVVSTRTDTVTGAIPELTQSLAISPDGRTLYGIICRGTGNAFYGGSVDVMSTATNTVTASIPLPDPWGYQIAVTPDNAYVEVLDAGNIEEISTRTQTLVNVTQLPHYEFEGIDIDFGADQVWLADVDNDLVDVVPELSRIDRVVPVSVTPGGATTVAVAGGRFTGATAVTFNGVPATSFKVVNGGAITAAVPAGTTGTVEVAVTTAAGTSAPATFTVAP